MSSSELYDRFRDRARAIFLEHSDTETIPDGQMNAGDTYFIEVCARAAANELTNAELAELITYCQDMPGSIFDFQMVLDELDTNPEISSDLVSICRIGSVTALSATDEATQAIGRRFSLYMISIMNIAREMEMTPEMRTKDELRYPREQS